MDEKSARILGDRASGGRLDWRGMPVGGRRSSARPDSCDASVDHSPNIDESAHQSTASFPLSSSFLSSQQFVVPLRLQAA